ARGMWIPAQLHIAPRVTRRPDQPVRKYVVVELVATFTGTFGALNVAGAGLTPGQPQAVGPTTRALPAPPPEEAAGDEDYFDDDPDTGPPDEPEEGLPTGDHGQADLPGEALPADVDERVQLLLERGHQAGLQDDETCDVVGTATRGRS